MKARIASVFLAAALLFALPCRAEAKAEPEKLLERIYTMTRSEEILKRHRSFRYTDIGEDSHFAYYADAGCIVKDWREDSGFVRIRTDGFDGCLFTDGTYGRWVNFETDDGSWDGLSRNILSEEILDMEEKDGLLTVTTRPSEQTRQEVIADEYPDTEDSDKIRLRVVYVLSTDTLELQSRTDYDTMPDGTEKIAWEIRVEYDVDSPYAQEVETIKEHLKNAEGSRTTTFIMDEGTPFEMTWVYTTAIGDGCCMPREITRNGIRYRIDNERSVPTNEEKDNDAVICLVRIDGE